jgi:hypothetical protein
MRHMTHSLLFRMNLGALASAEHDQRVLSAYNGNAVESGQWSALSRADAGLDESDSTPVAADVKSGEVDAQMTVVTRAR